MRHRRLMASRKLRRASSSVRRRINRRQRKQLQHADLANEMNRKLTHRALEPRMVFDGAAVATADAVMDAAPEAVDTAAAEQAQTESTQQSDELVAALNGASARNEIAFIDQSINNIDALIAELDPAIEIVLIDPDSDGLEQIATALDGRDSIDAIHIISYQVSNFVTLVGYPNCR